MCDDESAPDSESLVTAIAVAVLDFHRFLYGFLGFWLGLQVCEALFFSSVHMDGKKIVADEDADSLAIMEPISRLAERFRIPLEGAGADILKRSVVNLVRWSDKQFSTFPLLLLITIPYGGGSSMHAPTSSDWSNVLVLAELLFSLPASNGKLESVFQSSLPLRLRTGLCSTMNRWMTCSEWFLCWCWHWSLVGCCKSNSCSHLCEKPFSWVC